MKQEFYIRAEEEIKRRREINTEKLNQRRLEIEKAIPEYKEIKDRMAKTGQRLCEIIFSADNPKAQITRLQKESLAAGDMIKSLLIKNRYEPNFLDEVYTCVNCRDTGVYQNRRCSCFKEIVRRLASAELNASAPIKLSGFELFDLSLYHDDSVKAKMSRIYEFCKDYAHNFHLPCNGIFMKGATGLGKTHLSLAIAKVVIEKNYSVIYGSAPDLLRKIEKEHFTTGTGGQNDTAQLLQQTELLVLDDLGAEFESRFYVSAFYNLLNSRINAGLPTIVSTNLELHELKKRYEDRITSRLLTMEALSFCGEDIRVARVWDKV